MGADNSGRLPQSPPGGAAGAYVPRGVRIAAAAAPAAAATAATTGCAQRSTLCIDVLEPLHSTVPSALEGDSAIRVPPGAGSQGSSWARGLLGSVMPLMHARKACSQGPRMHGT